MVGGLGGYLALVTLGVICAFIFCLLCRLDDGPATDSAQSLENFTMIHPKDFINIIVFFVHVLGHIVDQKNGQHTSAYQ